VQESYPTNEKNESKGYDKRCVLILLLISILALLASCAALILTVMKINELGDHIDQMGKQTAQAQSEFLVKIIMTWVISWKISINP
jgi:flagellar basal body-associated protein FliL